MKHSIDQNQPEIVARYEAHLCSVFDASPMGRNFPDLVVGIPGRRRRVTDLVEIKNPDGKNRIEPGQALFAELWRGRAIVVVRSVEDVDAHVERVRAEP